MKLFCIHSLLLPSPLQQSWHSASCSACTGLWSCSTQDAENGFFPWGTSRDFHQWISLSLSSYFLVKDLSSMLDTTSKLPLSTDFLTVHFVSSPWLSIKLLKTCTTINPQVLHSFPVPTGHGTINFCHLNSGGYHIKSLPKVKIYYIYHFPTIHMVILSYKTIQVIHTWFDISKPLLAILHLIILYVLINGFQGNIIHLCKIECINMYV